MSASCQMEWPTTLVRAGGTCVNSTLWMWSGRAHHLAVFYMGSGMLYWKTQFLAVFQPMHVPSVSYQSHNLSQTTLAEHLVIISSCDATSWLELPFLCMPENAENNWIFPSGHNCLWLIDLCVVGLGVPFAWNLWIQTHPHDIPESESCL